MNRSFKDYAVPGIAPPPSRSLFPATAGSYHHHRSNSLSCDSSEDRASYLFSNNRRSFSVASSSDEFSDGVNTFCDGSALSHGPYLGSVTICSISSIILLSIKAYVFSVHSQLEVEASYVPSRRRLHIKKSWGMPILFLPSIVFSLGYIVIAYRTSCRARRKLLFHRDPNVMLSSKNLLSAFQKVPRSPTPMVKASKMILI